MSFSPSLKHFLLSPQIFNTWLHLFADSEVHLTIPVLLQILFFVNANASIAKWAIHLTIDAFALTKDRIWSNTGIVKWIPLRFFHKRKKEKNNIYIYIYICIFPMKQHTLNRNIDNSENSRLFLLCCHVYESFLTFGIFWLQLSGICGRHVCHASVSFLTFGILRLQLSGRCGRHVCHVRPWLF